PVRRTGATAQAACVEIAAEARAALLEAIAARTDAVEARAGAKQACFADPDAEAAAAPDVEPEAKHPHPHESDAKSELTLDRRISIMSVSEKVQLALHGNRDARMLLLRDRAGLVQSSRVRNPKT